MVGKWIGATPTQTDTANTGVFSISDIHYLKDEGEYIKDFAFQCEYLVVGGGGHGPGGFSGGYGPGGGGAGGLRNSYSGENSGGGAASGYPQSNNTPQPGGPGIVVVRYQVT